MIGCEENGAGIRAGAQGAPIWGITR
jgi:hypothetical protein